MIIIFLLLIISFNVTLSPLPSDAIIKGKDVEGLERQAKALACSVLLTNVLTRKMNKEKQIKEILKKNKIIKKDSELKQKIPEFLESVCYSKIDAETANEVLVIISEGKEDISNLDKYNYLFDIDSKIDFKKFKTIMNEFNTVMKEIEKEEKLLNEQRKDDTKLDKELKDLEKKLVKNKKYTENVNDKNEDIKENVDNNKKRKNKKKEKKEKKKKQQNEEINLNEEIKKNEEKKPESAPTPPPRKRKFSFKSFFEKLDLTTFWGFIISLIIILIFPFLFLKTNILKENETIKEKKEKQKNNKGNQKNKNNKDEETIKNNSDRDNEEDKKKEKRD